MPDPLPIPKQNVARAMDRAEHYRLLNEPAQAESICRDIVAVDPDNTKAWIVLLLALTDQFPDELTHAVNAANEVLAHIEDEYLHAYYQGIIYERWGRTNLLAGNMDSTHLGWIQQAMQSYKRAIELAPDDDPDPTLRWNTCARLMNKASQANHYSTAPRADRDVHAEYDETPSQFEE